jgi:glycosyltransferase involved in cell wall biosynthesis
LRLANETRRGQVIACCGHMVVSGGLERMTFEVLGALHRSGFGVHALLNRWESSRIARLAESANVQWDVYRCEEPLVRRPSAHELLRMATEIAQSSLEVVKAARRHRATHVLLPDFLVAVRHWPALVLLRSLGCRIVLRVGMAPARSRFYQALWRLGVNPVVDRIVCNSQFLHDEVVALGLPQTKVSMVRNTVARRPPAEGAAQHAHRVIYVGQIIPGKGLDILLDAIARLRAEGLPATLDVVGNISGWESPTYEGHQARVLERVGRPDLEDAVRLLGVREDVPDLMAQAAVHCCPSRRSIREGMAGVVLEAKAAGIPSVVSVSGSLPELVQHGVDGWVAEDSVDAIAEGLRHFLVDEQRRAAAGLAAKMSLEQFGRATFERGWCNVFDRQNVEGPPALARQGPATR